MSAARVVVLRVGDDELVVSRLAADNYALTYRGALLGHVGPFPSYYLVSDTEFVAAGIELDPSHPARYVEIGIDRVPTNGGVWATFPATFTPGMRVRFRSFDGDGELIAEIESEPLTPDVMGPKVDPSPPGSWARVVARPDESTSS